MCWHKISSIDPYEMGTAGDRVICMTCAYPRLRDPRCAYDNLTQYAPIDASQRLTTAYPMDTQGKMRYKAVGPGRGPYPNMTQRVAAGHATAPRRRREQSREGTALHATDKVEIGRTGLHVTRLGLGGGALPGARPATDPHQTTPGAEA